MHKIYYILSIILFIKNYRTNCIIDIAKNNIDETRNIVLRLSQQYEPICKKDYYKSVSNVTCINYGPTQRLDNIEVLCRPLRCENHYFVACSRLMVCNLKTGDYAVIIHETNEIINGTFVCKNKGPFLDYTFINTSCELTKADNHVKQDVSLKRTQTYNILCDEDEKYYTKQSTQTLTCDINGSWAPSITFTMCRRIDCVGKPGKTLCNSTQCTMQDGYYISINDGPDIKDSQVECQANGHDYTANNYDCTIQLLANSQPPSDCSHDTKTNNINLNPFCTLTMKKGFVYSDTNDDKQNVVKLTCLNSDDNTYSPNIVITPNYCAKKNETTSTYTNENCLVGSLEVNDPKCVIHCNVGYKKVIGLIESVDFDTYCNKNGELSPTLDCIPKRCPWPQPFPFFSSLTKTGCIKNNDGEPICELECLEGFHKGNQTTFTTHCKIDDSFTVDLECDPLKCTLPFDENMKDKVTISNQIFCKFDGSDYRGNCDLEAKRGRMFLHKKKFTKTIKFHCNLNLTSSKTNIKVRRNRCLLEKNTHHIAKEYLSYVEGVYRPICQGGYFTNKNIIRCQKINKILTLSENSIVCSRLINKNTPQINCDPVTSICMIDSGYYLEYFGRFYYGSTFTSEAGGLQWTQKTHECNIELKNVNTICQLVGGKYKLNPTCTFTANDGYAILTGSAFQRVIIATCVGKGDILDKEFTVVAMACKVNAANIPSHLHFTKNNCLFGASKYNDPTCTVECIDGFHNGNAKSFSIFCRPDGEFDKQLLCQKRSCSFPFVNFLQFEYDILNPAELCSLNDLKTQFEGNCKLKSRIKHVFNINNEKTRYLDFFCNNLNAPSKENVQIEQNQCVIFSMVHNIDQDVTITIATRYYPFCSNHYHTEKKFVLCESIDGVLKLDSNFDDIGFTLCTKLRCAREEEAHIDCPHRVCNLVDNYHMRLNNNELFEGKDFECEDNGMDFVITINSCSFYGANLSPVNPSVACRKDGDLVSFQGSCAMLANSGFIFLENYANPSATEVYKCSGINNKVTHAKTLEVGRCHASLQTQTYSFITKGCLLYYFDIANPVCDVDCIDGYVHRNTGTKRFQTACVGNALNLQLDCVKLECDFPIQSTNDIPQPQNFVDVKDASLCDFVAADAIANQRIEGKCVLTPHASYVFEIDNVKATSIAFHCTEQGISNIDGLQIILRINTCFLPLQVNNIPELNAETHLEITGDNQCQIESSTLVASVQGTCTLNSLSSLYAFRVGGVNIDSVDLSCSSDDTVTPTEVEIIRQQCETNVKDPNNYVIHHNQKCHFDFKKRVLITKENCRLSTRTGFIFTTQKNKTFVVFNCSMTPGFLDASPIYCPLPKISNGQFDSSCAKKVFGNVCGYVCNDGYISHTTMPNRMVCRRKKGPAREFEFLPAPKCGLKKNLTVRKRKIYIPPKVSIPVVAASSVAASGVLVGMYYNGLACFG